MQKKKTKETTSGALIIKTILVFMLILFILAIKFQYIRIKDFSFEKAKLYFHRDEKIYSDLIKWIENFLQPLIFPKSANKNSLSRSLSSDSYIYPAEGQIQSSVDGGIFIIVKKKTNILSPCEGKIEEVTKKGETFDIVIQQGNGILYRLENVDFINIQKGEILKKGQIIGYKLPFDLVGKDYVYFKKEKRM
ncbi:Peptidase M23 [Caldicellulosiruptor owensensis OL]|uniref:Peptidase M23 n=1 Tax=Caldicellulosiruptor owensensis (strain ATCC 700167 / DSM 13100 / OL) TaxID=632518 RepID=E4Q552_CALOW|nr:M23 family metallopeptidase [Caldicellulosiruptor owensensis]ADQ04219.1 Peptidase M23 [Caldicellulosiruptor owensensis OL]